MTIQIIPAIDILDGQVVRLKQGDYDQVTHYDFTPVGLAKHYVELGAKRIHLVDLNGAKDGTLTNKATFEAIRSAVDVHLDLGGGIRTLDNAKALFDCGIDELILGSLLIKDVTTAKTIIENFPGKISAGLDTHGDQIASDGWLETSETTLEQAVSELNNLPLASIIYTDISRDGMMTGPNIEVLTKLCTISAHCVIASGGIRNNDDIKSLTNCGKNLTGAITGKAILAGQISF